MLTDQKTFWRLLPKLLCGFVLCLLAPKTGVQATVYESRAQIAAAFVTTQSYLVTKSTDTNDNTCNSDCSLREAVLAANANPGLDTITLPSGLYNLTLTGAGEDATKGDLDIRDDLVIEGVDGTTTIIDGGAKDRLLHIARPASGATTAPNVTLRRVTLRNGKATNGGAIYSQGNLTLEQVTLANNQATQNGGAVACIDETADFTIRDSVISGNSAPSNQLFEGAGGGIYLSRCGTLSVERTTLQANSAQNGGAIYLNEAGYAINQSSVINNGARNNGGGIFAGATAGGAIGFSTLSGNQANGSGGGLYIGGDGSATLYNLAIVNNRADQDQTGDGDGGGLASRGFFRISQTILAGNSDGGGNLSPDCATNFAAESESMGYNLIQNSAGCLLGGTLTGNTTGIDPQLGALQANGGPTLTHLPAISSPVVDAIPLADCGASVDQRGVTRPQDSNSDGNPACDIGAVEVPTVPTGPCDFIASNEAALRNAITCVNAGREGVYTITVTADISYSQVSLALTNRLADRVVIQGNGHTLNAAQQGRVLTADTLRHLVVQDLTLTGGQGGAPAVPIVPEEGGGLLVYCGVAGNCTTQLDNVTVHHNQAASGGGLSIYCYVDTDCATTVQNSLIHHNQATTSGGGIDTGIDEENYTFALSVRDTEVHDNRAEFGGGIRAHAGDFQLINSTLHHNEAVEGGGIYTRSGYILRARISNSTIHSNQATQGGGIYAFSRDSGGVAMTLVNSTVSSNAVLTGTGGGLYLGSEFSSGQVALINSTVAQNGAATGAGLFFFNRSSESAVDNAVVISNTLIADNNGADCASDGFAPLSQPLRSGGNNLDSDGSCLTPAIAQASDIVGGAANLGPLVNNGGATLTHAPLSGSAALDAGNDTTCAAAPVNGLDQRAVARPQSVHCDIGAVEVVVGAACDLLASDEASLRRAIECVNSASAGVYTVTLTADIRYTQPIATISNLAISNLLIAGNGHTLDAQGHGRVLALDNVPNATLRDLTLTGGRVDVNDLAPNGGGLSLNCSNNQVDAETLCTWTLINTTVRNNQAASGGGIDYRCDYHGGGALIVQDSEIRDNQAINAGGGIIYSSDEESGACSLTLRNTRVQGNRAVDGGGMRILRPRVTLIDSTLRDNVASESGGGLMARISDGFITLTVHNSTISGNRAGVSGGGLYIASPDQTFNIDLVNSTVSGNQVISGTGGGLYLGTTFGSLRVALLNSTVAQNRAGQGAGVHIFDQEDTGYLTDTLQLTNTIITDNGGSDCASATVTGGVISGSSITSHGNNLDGDGSCLTPAVAQANDIVSGTANLGPLADNGGPTQTHALLPGSAASDAGNDAACAADPVNGVDQRGVARPQGAHCDIGAYEADVSTATRQVFVSSTSSGQVGNLHFRDEDILAYDPATSLWTLIFDGSDVGISDDVDAFAFQDDGSLLLSLSNPITLTGLGLVDDSDIVKFMAATLGVTTTGTFAWYLDGSDVGLAADEEDIDAMDFAPDGRLLVSPSNNGFDATGVTDGHDEDVFVLNGAVFGEASSGVWELYLDGSAVAISTGRDINGLWVDPANGDLYVSTNGSYSVPGLSGDKDDIFVCTPTALGAASACTFRLFWDGDTTGFGQERLDGVDIGPTPASFNRATSAITAADTLGAEPQEEGAEDDEEGNVLVNVLFLPVLKR